MEDENHASPVANAVAADESSIGSASPEPNPEPEDAPSPQDHPTPVPELPTRGDLPPQESVPPPSVINPPQTSPFFALCVNTLKTVNAEPCLFLFSVAWGLVMVSKPNFFFFKMCVDHSTEKNWIHNPVAFCYRLRHSNVSLDFQNFVQSRTSSILMQIGLAGTLPLAMSTIVLSSWSDRNGRIPPIAIATLGHVMQYLTLVATATFPLQINAYIAAAVTVFSGNTGGQSQIMSSCFASIVDVVPQSQQTIRMAIAEGVMALGLVVGSLMPMLVKHNWPVVLLLVIVFDSAGMLYAVLVMRETIFKVVEEKPQVPQISNVEQITVPPVTKKPCNRFLTLIRGMGRQYREMFLTLTKKRRGLKRMMLVIGAGAYFFLTMADQALNNLRVLYVKSDPFRWGMKHIDEFTAVSALTQASVMMFIMILGKKLFAASDSLVASIACLGFAGQYGFMAVSRMNWQVYAGIPLSAVGLLAYPSLRVFMLDQAESAETGKVMGLTMTLATFAIGLSGVVFNSIYNSSLAFFPGLAFVVGSALLTIVAAVLLFAYVKQRRYSPEDDEWSVVSETENERY